jgi:hypothetical protein
MVPRVTELCRKVLEDEGVAGDVTVSEVRVCNMGIMLTSQFKLEFVPLEEDLLSLEMDDVARDLYLVGCAIMQARSFMLMWSAWRRHADILLLLGSNDLSKSFRTIPTHIGQGRRSTSKAAFLLARTSD